MTAELSTLQLAQLAEFVASHMGLHFPPERAADLQRGMQAAAREFGFQDAGECAQWLLSAPLTREQEEILAGNLTVGETYFLRERGVFAMIEEQVLPELIRTRRGGEQRLRLWSAACCSGEEPYSLAISVRRMLPDLANWQVTILASDINPRFLRRAARGVFGEWSFRDTPPGFKERHFTRTEDGRWEIQPEIRRMVDFFQLNLAKDAYPSLLNNTNAVDLILCRNVLIYFAPEPFARVIKNLARCLTEGGWLVLGPNEVSQAALPDLAPVRFPGTVFHRKDSSSPRPAELRFPRWEEEGQRRDFSTPPVATFFAPDIPVVPEPASVAPLPMETVPSPGEPALLPVYEQAVTLFDQGRYADAAALLAGDSTEPRVLALLVRAKANQGRLAEALAGCDRLIAADKLNAEGHYLRATVLQELGELTAAVSAFKRALYLDQDFVPAHFALGHLARAQGRRAEADRHFANALALARRHRPEEILPETEGLTAGRLAEILTDLREEAAAA